MASARNDQSTARRNSGRRAVCHNATSESAYLRRLGVYLGLSLWTAYIIPNTHLIIALNSCRIETGARTYAHVSVTSQRHARTHARAGIAAGWYVPEDKGARISAGLMLH